MNKDKTNEPCFLKGDWFGMIFHTLLSLWYAVSPWIKNLWAPSQTPWPIQTSSLHPWSPTPVLLPGESHGRRSLVGCSPWGCEESDTTERLHFRFSLSCIGEGNGNPLQCSCLENPRDGGASWASVCGVAQSRTRLKQLSSSSNSSSRHVFRDFITYGEWSAHC